MLLVVALMCRRIERIAEASIKVDSAGGSEVRLLELRFVHPACMRASWQSIASATKYHCVIAGKVTEYSALAMQVA